MEVPLEEEEEAYGEEEGEYYEEEEGYAEEEAGEEEAYVVGEEEGEEEGAAVPLTEEEEIAKLEADGWVNTSKIKGPPSRLAPKPPAAQEKLAQGKKDTWQQVKSDRNWAEDVDLSPQLQRHASPSKRAGSDVHFDVPSDISERYTIGELLERTQFSQVKLGQRKSDGKAVVLKFQSRNTTGGLSLESVGQVLEAVRGKSPHLSELVETVAAGDTRVFVLAKREGPTLLRGLVGLPAFSERLASRLIRDVLLGLKVLSEEKVVHLNVTPENVLFLDSAKSQVSLEGFTLCRRVEADSSAKGVAGGVLQFQAPEVVFSTGFSCSADAWSLGVLAFVLLTGGFPFKETHPARLKVCIKKAVVDYPFHLSSSAKSFLQGLLVANPADRLTPDAALAHPFITQPEDRQIPDFAKNLETLVK